MDEQADLLRREILRFIIASVLHPSIHFWEVSI